jgi:hypothetical protein
MYLCGAGGGEGRGGEMREGVSVDAPMRPLGHERFAPR